MTFGEHLRQFALSVDFIEPMQCQQVQEQIRKYLQVQLGAVQVGLFEKMVIDDREGMAAVWSYPSLCLHQTLRNSDNRYRRQLALALGESRNLWVVSERDERLSSSNPGVDVWGEKEDRDLPPFYAPTDAQPAKTSVILITRDARGVANGAFVVEMQNRVRPTKVLKQETSLLADAVGLLHATDRGTREQREGTNKAIANLAELVRRLELDTGPRPLLFLASAHRAKTDVMRALNEVLADFVDHVFVRRWSEMQSPGNINLQLADEIRRAQYGICYLSEEDADEKGTFRDNPNVLVEAGMLHMVTQATTAAGTGWIPIREANSARMPFDLESQRMVIVERSPDGILDEERFRTDLSAKLSALLWPEQMQTDYDEARLVIRRTGRVDTHARQATAH
jgi:hypothetical protein